ncbi:membrane-associated protein, putative [Bodo saltans]|uniref:Membrane-associated protein, putative n=1 Tax=Bodo saltans TaxID=75058 RepID=A0A0S4IQI1_BODSA|nr:membrane-associated protein, putative [Bodo saltans]|eukprot:CUF19486.1 membrane-associated protein, putative [Bodo saltans]
MNLRLMVTAPSNIVVGGYVSAIRYSMLISLVTIFGLCIALVLASSFILQTLASMESEIFYLARSFLFQSMWETQTTRLHDEVERPRCCATAFSEFRRIFGAIRRLSRALYTLRAFSPSEMTPATSGGMGNSTSGDANSRCYSASQSSFMSPIIGLVEVVPYHILGNGSSGLWRVPVTTIFIGLDPFMFNPQTQEAMTIYNSHRAILEVFQKHVAKFAGASLDQFYGNRFLIHFNASGRTPKHALAALSVALGSLREVPDGVSFGISSSVSMCGYMGPPSCKVFTVVSNNVTHAGIMTRLAPEFKILGKLRVLLTWRATEVVKLEQRALIRKAAALLPNSQSVTRASSSRSFAALSMFDETAVTCEFKPIVEILLPREEANVPPYAYGVVPVADQARNVVSQ